MSSNLVEFSNELASLAENAGKAVVRVDARRRMPASGVVFSAGGAVVTAAHVIEQETGITVGLPNGETKPAVLKGIDPTTDLALLQVDGLGLAALPAANPARVGQLVVALGRPGETIEASVGFLSMAGGKWRTGAGGSVDRYLQPDVIMYPGFSGGALVSAEGGLIGLNTSALLPNAAATLPVETIERVVKILMEHGHVLRGYLGVTSQPVRLPEGAAEKLGQKSGLVILAVEPETPAAKAGMLVGDILVTISGDPIRHVEDLQAALGGDRIGSPLSVRVVHGGELNKFSVTLTERK